MLKIIRMASRGLLASRSSSVLSIVISNHTSCNRAKGLVAEQQQSRRKSSYLSSDKRANDKKKRSLVDVVDDSMYKTGARTRSQTKAAAVSASRSDTTSSNSVASLEIQEDGSGDCTRATDGRSRNSLDSSSVRHDKKLRQFLLDLGDNQVAHIDYKQIGSNRIDLYHTEVPAELRGKGLGRLLAEGALEKASRANLRLKVTCEYLQHFLDRYADDKHRKLVD